MQVVDCMTVRTSLFARMVVVLLLAVAVAPGLAGAQEQERSAIPAETLIEAARAALADDRVDDAEFLLKGVRPGEGDIDDLDFLHGTIAAKRGEWQEAIARFRAMIARNPDLPRVRLDLALAYFQAGEDGNAARHFRLALGTKDLPPVVRTRALAFLDQDPAAQELVDHRVAGGRAGQQHKRRDQRPAGRAVRPAGVAVGGCAPDQRRRGERQCLRRLRGEDLARSAVPGRRRAAHADLPGGPVQRADGEPARGPSLPLRQVRPAPRSDRAAAPARRRCL